MSIPAFVGDELMCPSDYLGAADLMAKGREEATLTIASVQMQDLMMQGGKTNRKAVLMFKETPKKMVLNKTNINTLVNLYGCKGEDWMGKRITVYHTTTNVGAKKNQPCLRVRPVVPAAKQDQQAQTENK